MIDIFTSEDMENISLYYIIKIDVMHYRHSIKCRCYLGSIFILQRLYKVLHHRIDGYTQNTETT
jgi:hypothetical protein